MMNILPKYEIDYPVSRFVFETYLHQNRFKVINIGEYNNYEKDTKNGRVSLNIRHSAQLALDEVIALLQEAQLNLYDFEWYLKQILRDGTYNKMSN